MLPLCTVLLAILLLVGLMVQLVWRHSCGADRLLAVDRFSAGPRVRLKTVDPPKGNGTKKKLAILLLLFTVAQLFTPFSP